MRGVLTCARLRWFFLLAYPACPGRLAALQPAFLAGLSLTCTATAQQPFLPGSSWGYISLLVPWGPSASPVSLLTLILLVCLGSLLAPHATLALAVGYPLSIGSPPLADHCLEHYEILQSLCPGQGPPER